MGVVQSPPLGVPPVGLIASLGPAGGPYLDPPDNLDAVDWPPFNPDRPIEMPGDLPARGPVQRGDVDTPPEPAQRWEDEVRYLPEQFCGTGTAQDPCAPGMFDQVQDTPDEVQAKSFEVVAGDTCSSSGWRRHDFVGRATRALLAVESRQIAHELWTGELAASAGWPNTYLASTASDMVTNGAATPASALDCLEAALADCGNGQRGAIHCTPQLGSFWSGIGQTLRNVNGLILTYRGTIIIPDAGYDGSGPGGTPASGGSQWAYATLLPTVRRGEVIVNPGSYDEAIDRRLNTITWYAHRVANVSLPDCCLIAAQVDLPLCLIGGAS
jgi:hypothetical protein